MKTGLALLAAGSLALPVLHAQAFEVASIRPHDATLRAKAGVHYLPAGRAAWSNLTVKLLVEEAYGMRNYQVTGGLPWVAKDRYDLESKAAGPASEDELRRMLQSLLAELFKLVSHRETRELQVYDLVVARGGPKLRELNDGEPVMPPVMMSTMDGRERFSIIFTQEGKAGTMTRFAASLAGELGRPVIDKTELTGIYDTTVKLGEIGDDAADKSGAILAVMEDQLGLKLIGKKEPVEILIIDSVDRPDPN